MTQLFLVFQLPTYFLRLSVNSWIWMQDPRGRRGWERDGAIQTVYDHGCMKYYQVALIKKNKLNTPVKVCKGCQNRLKKKLVKGSSQLLFSQQQ